MPDLLKFPGWCRFWAFWWAMEHSPQSWAPYLFGAAIGRMPHRVKGADHA